MSHYWFCEIHPTLEWPHDDCAGPGVLGDEIPVDTQLAIASIAEAVALLTSHAVNEIGTAAAGSIYDLLEKALIAAGATESDYQDLSKAVHNVPTSPKPRRKSI